jgi:hypothetical protein
MPALIVIAGLCACLAGLLFAFWLDTRHVSLTPDEPYGFR